MNHPTIDTALSATVAPRPAADVLLRAASVADIDAVNAVVGRALDSWNLAPRVRRLAAPSLEYAPHDLAHMDLLLATARDGGALGVAAFETAGANDAPPRMPALLLQGLYVVPDAQHRGIGTRLLHAVLAAAAARGVAGVVVRPWRDAAGYFTRHGFVARDPSVPPDAPAARLWRAVP